MLIVLFFLSILFVFFILLFYAKKNKLEKKEISYVKKIVSNEEELQKLKNLNENLETELQFVKDIYRNKLLQINMPTNEK